MPTPPPSSRLLSPPPARPTPQVRSEHPSAMYPQAAAHWREEAAAALPSPSAAAAAAVPSSLFQRRPMKALSTPTGTPADSSDSEWSASESSGGSSRALLSPSASSPSPATGASVRRTALVRMLWPMPLRSASTYACLFGFCMLSLVLVDEVATHLRRGHLHGHAEQQPLPAAEGQSPLLHVLRHSFLYRCLLCITWLVVVFVHGLYVHRGGRRGVGSSGQSGSGRRRRSSSSSSTDTPAHLSPPATYAGIVKKSVSFARSGNSSADESPALRPASSPSSSPSSSGAAAAISQLAPSARPATRKRLQMFSALALVLALCGAAFELYLALVSHGNSAASTPPAHLVAPAIAVPPAASAVATELWDGASGFFSRISWSWTLSVLVRALLMLLWLALCALVAYFAWWRKAIGTRKTRGPARKAPSTPSHLASVEEGEEQEDDDEDWSDEDSDGEGMREDEEAHPRNVASLALQGASSSAGGAPSAPYPPPIPSAALLSPPTADASLQPMVADGSTSAVGVVGVGGGGGISDSELDDEEEETDEEDMSEEEYGEAGSFPIPSAAQLLLAEKLDASLFFHPEQGQNQWAQGAAGTLASSARDAGNESTQRNNQATDARRGGSAGASSASATTSPAPMHGRGGHVLSRRASDQGRTIAYKSMAQKGGSSMEASSSSSSSTTVASSSSSLSSLPPLPPLPSSHLPLNPSTLFHLASTKFIAALSRADFAAILPELRWQQLEQGEDVYRKGQRMGQRQQQQEEDGTEADEQGVDASSPSSPSPPFDSSLFIVVSGTLGALNPHTAPGSPPEILCTFHQGDSLGELEFLFPHLPRSATVRALSPTVQLLRIPSRLGRLWRRGTTAEGGQRSGSDGDAPGVGAAKDVAASASSSVAASSSLSLDATSCSSLVPDAAPFAPPSPSASLSSASFLSALSRARSDTPDHDDAAASALTRGFGPKESDGLRSDILLSFVRTTLARQWRSAQFILDQFLHIPLTEEDVRAVQPEKQQQQGGGNGRGTNGTGESTSSASPPSRYWTPAFASFFPPASSPLLHSLRHSHHQRLELPPGQTLFEEGAYRTDQLFIVLSGGVTLSSQREGSRELGPGSVLNAVAYLTDSCHSHSCKASSSASFGSELTHVAWLTRSDLATPNAEILRLALEVCALLAPTLAQFHSLGLQRSWIRAGTLLFHEGEKCEALHVIAQGKVRIVTGKMKRLAHKKKPRTTVTGGTGAPPVAMSVAPTGPPAGLSNSSVAGGRVPVSLAQASAAQKKRSAPASSSSSSVRPAALAHPSGLDLTPFTEAHTYASTQHTAGGVWAAVMGKLHGSAASAPSSSSSSSSSSSPHAGTSSVNAGAAGSAGSAGASRVKFELCPGELVGELSFFNGMGDEEMMDYASGSGSFGSTPRLPAPRHSSTALCTKDTELIRISRPCFSILTSRYPRTMIKLLAIVSKRMRDLMNVGSPASAGGGSASAASMTGSNGGRASVLSSIPRSPFLRTPSSRGGSAASAACCSVCLLTSSPLVPLQDFSLALSVSLSSFGRTILLSPLHVDRVLGEGTCANLNSYTTRSLFNWWVAHLEAHYAFVILVADQAVSAWTRTCTRQADLILIVANAEGDEAGAAGAAGAAADGSTPAASTLPDPDEDSDDEPEDDGGSATALLRARQRRELGRMKRVSKFERIVVWDEGVAVPEGGASASRRKSARAMAAAAAAAAVPASPADRMVGQRVPATPSSLSTASFSPTLHPSPAPEDAAAAAQAGSVGSGSMAPPPSASSNSTAGPNVTGNYRRCAPRMNFALKDLVLLYPATTSMPRGTRFWLAPRPALHRFHHVASGCAEHMDRLARYIAGKTIGVVLSGGGARGLSHLGVLTSFAEQGVPIDYVGGTSQGSFMAALYASQPFHHPQALGQMKSRVHQLAERMGSIRHLLADATFPMLSYFAGHKFGANISVILGPKTRIEDLWIPFFLVTTNLSQADMCVHETGRLWKAVRASMTVLDYLPPLQMSRAWPDLLIDGGYTNNLPVDVMHGLFKPAYVIGVDVENKAADEKLMRVSYYGSHLSGWWLLRKRVTEWLKGGWIARGVSTIKRIVMRSHKEEPPAFFHLPKFAELVGSLVYINHNRNIRNSLASKLIDLYIRPDLGTTALLDYHREDEIVERGYACTKVRLTEWRLRNSSHLPKATPPPFAPASLGASPTVGAITGASSVVLDGSISTPPSTAARAASLTPSLQLDPGSSAVASSGGAHASSLPRRKSSVTTRPMMGAGSGAGPLSSFLPPPSLTFTLDLSHPQPPTPVTLSHAHPSPLQRSRASPSAQQHTPSSAAAAATAASALSLDVPAHLFPSTSESSLSQADAHAHARSEALRAHDEQPRASSVDGEERPAGAGAAASGGSRGSSIMEQLRGERDGEAKETAAGPGESSPVLLPAAATAPLRPGLDDSLLRYTSTLSSAPLRRNVSEGSLPQD